MSTSTEVVTKIKSITSTKSDEKATHNTPVMFNFNVNLEEADRTADSVKLNFQMTMDTDPPIAKFSIDGFALVTGDPTEIEKTLAPDPQTNVPQVFTRIYQQVYSVVFMLAGTIDVPYPSPALLKRAHVRSAIPQNQIQP